VTIPRPHPIESSSPIVFLRRRRGRSPFLKGDCGRLFPWKDEYLEVTFVYIETRHP